MTNNWKLIGRYEGLKEAYNLAREHHSIDDDAMIELLSLIDDVEQLLQTEGGE